MRIRLLVGIMLCIYMLTACSNMTPDNRSQSGNDHTGAWDADSRNNEDPGLGAKSLNNPPQPGIKTPTLDSTIAHYNSGFVMDHSLSELVKQIARIPSAAVAVTNNNVYVAVDPGGHFANGIKQQTADSVTDPAKGAGIFGSGAGYGLDWVSSKQLSKEASAGIFNELRRFYPKSNVYISGNPHFVTRMMYYEHRQRQGQGMGDYLNEFNTMVQYAFPDYANGRNRMIP